MRRATLMLTLLATALWSAPSLAQSRLQFRPLGITDTTPADQQIDAWATSWNFVVGTFASVF
jgi:hypothetical protein